VFDADRTRGDSEALKIQIDNMMKTLTDEYERMQQLRGTAGPQMHAPK